jgi:hypothetical protein
MFRSLVPFALVLVGCSGTDPLDGGQYGEEAGASCAPQSSSPLAADEVSALGFAPQAMLDLVGPAQTVPLTWADGSVTDLTLEVTVDGAMELVDYELEESEGDGTAAPAIELGCADLVEIEVRFRFSTADGLLDEEMSARLTSADGQTAGLTVDLDRISGTLDPWAFAPEGNDWDELRAWMMADWSAAGPSGVIDGQGSGTDGDLAFAESVTLAAWGAASE